MRKIAILTILAASLLSCIGRMDGESAPGDFVQLRANVRQIDVDKGEKTIFTVLANGADMTDLSYIVDISSGEEQILKNADGGYAYEFKADQVGIYSFKAIYNETRSQLFFVRAISQSNQSTNFFRRNCTVRYTGTWCVSCNDMSERIKEISAKRPDRIVPIDIYTYSAITSAASEAMMAYINLEALPRLMIDYRQHIKISAPNEALITSDLDLSSSENPVAAGIKMNVTRNVNKLFIETETMVDRAGEYKLVVAVLVDGYAYEQMGVSDPNHRQYNVLTEFLSQEVEGDELGVMNAGDRVAKNYAYVMSAGIDVNRYRVAAYVLNKSEAGGFFVNNAAHCNINESFDYQYEQ